MLAFPPVPAAPGLYRFTLSGPSGTRVYIGESQRIAKRFQHYRTPGGPGERQTTKFRLNRLMLDTLVGGGQVAVDIAVQAETGGSDGRPSALDLSQRAVRQHAERAAITAEQASGSVLLNLGH
jgi:hypothetical protein